MKSEKIMQGKKCFLYENSESDVILIQAINGHELEILAAAIDALVAVMAARCERINPDNQSAPQELQDKHYFRKHGENAYYGQK